MITNVKIIDSRFKSRIGKSEMAFLPGINIICGPNGCGKSSLLEAIRHEVEVNDHTVSRLIRDQSVPVMFYSAESATVKLGANANAAHSERDLTARHQSHGQGLHNYLNSLSNISGEVVVLMDEPETALSMEATISLCKAIHEKSDTVQWIVATHSPVMWTLKNANVISMDPENPEYSQTHLAWLKNRIK